jgi:hypothetical protein
MRKIKNQPYTARAGFLLQVAVDNGFRATHYLYYGVQNHRLPNNFPKTNRLLNIRLKLQIKSFKKFSLK